MSVRIRRQTPRDQNDVAMLYKAVFPSSGEGTLVRQLWEADQTTLALVAEFRSSVVGHIMFSPVSIEGQDKPGISGLAPMAVQPEFQRSGVGKKLVTHALTHCRELGVDAVVVLGHPNYHRRFGFRPAIEFGLSLSLDAPSEAFMALELRPSSLAGVEGTVTYLQAFSTL